jgi:hypothetical protein
VALSFSTVFLQIFRYLVEGKIKIKVDKNGRILYLLSGPYRQGM